MNRGSEIERRLVEFLAVPSMRPRFMNRGSFDAEDLISEIPPPSMRPRFMNRGSGLATRYPRVRSTALQ